MALPSFAQGAAPWKPLANYQKQLPSLFDTSGVTQGYERQINDQQGMARSLAAASMAAYANRAAQSGGSALGAGFAGGQALLGGFRQANQLRSDLAGKVLQSNAQQASIGSDLASRIGQLQSTRQGQLSDWYQNQARLTQSQNQFNSDLDYRNRSLAQNQNQFNSSQNERSREFDMSFGQQGNSQRLQALLALQRQPQKSFSYHTDMFGNPMTGTDQTAMQGYNHQNSMYQGIQNQLQSFAGF